jgi:hypothetical protein
VWRSHAVCDPWAFSPGNYLGLLALPLTAGVLGFFLYRRFAKPVVDEVYLDGDELVVRNNDQQDRVSFGNIIKVTDSWSGFPERIKVTLKRPCLFGSKITFYAPIRWRSLATHPIAIELMQRVSRGRQHMIFTVLLHDEAKEIGVRVDWNADVSVTPKMLAASNFPIGVNIAQQGRLLEPLVLGQQTIPVGHAIFMDDFGVYYIES